MTSQNLLGFLGVVLSQMTSQQLAFLAAVLNQKISLLEELSTLVHQNRMTSQNSVAFSEPEISQKTNPQEECLDKLNQINNKLI